MLKQSAALDLVFHALADPSRRAMVERLSCGPASVSELAKPLALSLPAVVQHLHVLQASGLVRSEKVGRVRTCRIEPAALQTAEHWISAAHELAAAPRPAGRLSRCAPRRISRRGPRMTDRSVTHATFVVERTYSTTKPRSRWSKGRSRLSPRAPGSCSTRRSPSARSD